MRVVDGSVVNDRSERAALPDILDCDLVLNAADNAWPRHVLDEAAFTHLIPMVNGGSNLKIAKDGGFRNDARCEITPTEPSHQCWECHELYTETEVGAEEAGGGLDEGYVDDPHREPPDIVDDDEPAEAVMETNQIVAGKMVVRLKAFMLGVARETGLQRYRPREGIIEWEDFGCDADCSRIDRTAAGDTVYIRSGRDPNIE